MYGGRGGGVVALVLGHFLFTLGLLLFPFRSQGGRVQKGGFKEAGCRRAVSRRQGAEGWFQGGRIQMGALEPVCLFIY